MDNVFPFGMPLKRLEQLDKSPKKVFVLGVYASAVHARWIGPDKKIKVRALAVASEPYIFWRGEGDFGSSSDEYGKCEKIKINGIEYDVYALAHPRQVGHLGASNIKWKILHDSWLKKLIDYA